MFVFFHLFVVVFCLFLTHILNGGASVTLSCLPNR